MPIRPGKSSRLVLIVEPHRGQNIQWTFPPDAPLRVKVELSPRRLMTCSELHRDERENALPERFWHRVQLQAVTIAGSPSTVMLSCPHWQVAVRIPSYLLLPSLLENHTASSRSGKSFWSLRLAPQTHRRRSIRAGSICGVPAGLACSDETLPAAATVSVYAAVFRGATSSLPAM
jgi:hypothetical protein